MPVAGRGASHGLCFSAAHEAVTNNERDERTRRMVLATLISLDLHASRTSIANLEPRYASPEKSNAAALIYLITREFRANNSGGYRLKLLF